MFNCLRQVIKVPKIERLWIRNMMLAVKEDKLLKENILSKDSYNYIFCRDRLLSNKKVQDNGHTGGTFRYTYDIMRDALLTGKKIKIGDKKHWDTYGYDKFFEGIAGKW